MSTDIQFMLYAAKLVLVWIFPGFAVPLRNVDTGRKQFAPILTSYLLGKIQAGTDEDIAVLRSRWEIVVWA